MTACLDNLSQRRRCDCKFKVGNDFERGCPLGRAGLIEPVGKVPKRMIMWEFRAHFLAFFLAGIRGRLPIFFVSELDFLNCLKSGDSRRKRDSDEIGFIFWKGWKVP